MARDGARDVLAGGQFRKRPLADHLDLAGRLALRPREAAEALGVSERTIRSLLPELPHVRVGGVVLLPVDALRRWLEEKAKASEERAAAVAREILEAVQGPK